MDPVRFSITKPVSVMVGVILIVMFGIIGLGKLPMQLTPDVETPQITVETVWPGATPYEVEREIIENQEEALKSVRGLIKMESSSYDNMGTVTLTFSVGTDIDDVLLRVSNKLDEVTGYPMNVDKPVINASGAQSSPVIWMMLKTKAEDKSEILNSKTFFEDEVRQYIERVPGVGALFVFGGVEEQLDVVVDRDKLARYRIGISHVINRLTSANRNTAAGLIGISKKNYRLRTVSQFNSIDDALNVVLLDNGRMTIRIRDVAEAKIGHEKNLVAVMHNADPVIVIGVRKEKGANVIELTNSVKAVVAGLNEGALGEKGLYIDVVHDETGYINQAVDIVRMNVIIGGILAIIVLLLFLRSVTSTITAALTIPISIIGTFIFLWLMGRNINVVSLAGISFAVGMLVDNSIVVIENIDRHRKMGKDPFTASYDGAREVWGAVLASTLTTVAVFLPVIFIEEEAGQLFRDIAIAITFAIILSLFVSVSVIPSLINQFYRIMKGKKKSLGILDSVGRWLNDGLIGLSNLSLRSNMTRLLTVVLLPVIAVLVTIMLIPKAEYLPQGNRNMIINILMPPPGYSLEKRTEIGNYIFDKSKPHFEQDWLDGVPQIKDMFYVAADRFNIFGGISAHETEASKLIPFYQGVINSIPGIMGFSMQAGIFQENIGRGRTIDVNISGADIDTNIKVARTMFGMLMGKIPGSQVRPVPSLETSYPEANVIPDSSRLAANGLSESELGQYVDVVMDGRKIGDFKPEGKKSIDFVVMADEALVSSPEDVMEGLIPNAHGGVVRVKDVARLEYGQGMAQIDHLERRRNITLIVNPPMEMPLQLAMETVETDVVGALREAGQLEGVTVDIGGNADKLTETRTALQWNFVLAVIITYLLLAAMLESFLYPLVILFSVPLAAAGGFMGLALENLLVAPQAFDILTMLGFVMLIGMVVNNAILIVYQSLNNVRGSGMEGIDAIKESVRTRIRPIFMSATTSVLAFMPMVLSTGAGSELYRGIGSVILGGLAVSTIFTIFVIPALLSFVIGRETRNSADTQ